MGLQPCVALGRCSGRRAIAAWAAVALVIALCGAAGGMIAGRAHAHADAQRSHAAFVSASDILAADLELAIQHESDLVVAAAAFIADHPDATNSQLQFWGESVRALERYPELLGLGYTTIVRASQLQHYADAIRTTRPDLLSRNGKLTIVPPGRRPFYCLRRAAFTRLSDSFIPLGTDYCAGSDVLKTIERGRWAYQPLTIGLTKVLSIETPVYRTGVVPVSRSVRRAEFLGWVGSGIAPAVVLERALRDHPRTAVELSYRGDGQPAVFRAGDAPGHAARHRVDFHNGWTVTVFGSVRSAAVVPNDMALALTLIGAAGAVLVGLLVFLLGSGRARALRIVAERTRQLGYQALHDGLTDLPNRTLVLDRAGQLLARGRRHPEQVVVAMFVDLDDFKHVNDTHGHAAGDRVLREVAERLRSVVREQDTVGRVGGDEFIVLVESSPGDDEPAKLAARVIERVRAPIALADGGAAVTVSASVGVAVGLRDHPDELLRDADLALYEAKTLGKDRYALFRPHMHAAVKDRLELEADLAHALANDEFFLLYQPTFDLRSHKVLGVEALIRWRHPRRGVIRPDAFIPVAEQSGHILAIGSWVLHEACAQAAEWRRAGHGVGVAVNVSAYQLDRDGLAGEVGRALAASQLEPEALTLEITESALMHDVPAAARRLTELKALGVRVAIDDFGTGYSSLSYLRQFPVDALKIDRSFIAAIAASDGALAIIRTLVQLGKTLHLETLAEGIEDQAQLDRLCLEHCDQGQGFLFARPLEPAKLSSFLAGTVPPSALSDRPAA